VSSLNGPQKVGEFIGVQIGGDSDLNVFAAARDEQIIVRDEFDVLPDADLF